MTEETERTRDRFDLSLDGRQIASIVVGALVILGVVFVLGLNVGRQLAARELATGGADALAALDQPPVPPSEPIRDEELTYGEKLTRPTPAPIAVAPAAPAPAAAAVPSAAPAATRPDPVLEPSPVRAAGPVAVPAPAPAKPAVATTVTRATPAASRDWTVQVGSAQDRAEATRLAKRFERWNARVETADLGAKGRWYRVRVGRYGTREAAERFLRDLQRETGAKGYVTSAK